MYINSKVKSKVRKHCDLVLQSNSDYGHVVTVS